MPAKYLLDSTILIDHLNEITQATKFLDKLDSAEAVISVITRAEILAGADDDWELLSHWLDEYTCLPIGPDEADMAAAIRSKHAIKLSDAFQAAIAKNEDLVLVTRDADFKKISSLEVKVPYHL